MIFICKNCGVKHDASTEITDSGGKQEKGLDYFAKYKLE